MIHIQDITLKKHFILEPTLFLHWHIPPISIQSKYIHITGNKYFIGTICNNSIIPKKMIDNIKRRINIILLTLVNFLFLNFPFTKSFVIVKLSHLPSLFISKTPFNSLLFSFKYISRIYLIRAFF